MKKLVVPIAILLMAGLIAGAVALDCVRIAADARRRVELADDEVAKHEQHLVQLLKGSNKRSPEVEAAIKAYQRAAEPHARHAAYEQLVAGFRQTMSTSVDPTNPLDRRFMDDIAGAINRREIAEQPYDEESAAYQAFWQSRRGSIARWFSPQAQSD